MRNARLRAEEERFREAVRRRLYPHPHDRPLIGQPHPDRPLHPRLYGCELAATMILMMVGVGSNVVLGSALSPLGRVLALHPVWLTALQGLCFGGSGTLAALSPFGRVSGGHVSPSVSLAFMLGRRLAPLDWCGYVSAQVLGAVLGTGVLALLGVIWPVWGAWCRSTHFAATVPCFGLPAGWVVLGEAVTTTCLIGAVLVCGASEQWRVLTPFLSGPLFFLLNPAEAWMSGDSTNAARTFGPDVFAGTWQMFWVYLVGPGLGVVAAIVLIRFEVFGRVKLHEARVAYFGHGGRAPYFFRSSAPVPAPPPNGPSEGG